MATVGCRENKFLSNLCIGESAKVSGFTDDDTRDLSMRIGLYEGKTVRCTAKPGPIVVVLNHQTIAVGERLAQRICIE